MESEQQTAEKLRQTLRQAEEQQQQHQASLAEAEKEIARVDRVIAEKQARLEVLAPNDGRRRRTGERFAGGPEGA